ESPDRFRCPCQPGRAPSGADPESDRRRAVEPRRHRRIRAAPAGVPRPHGGSRRQSRPRGKPRPGLFGRHRRLGVQSGGPGRVALDVVTAGDGASDVPSGTPGTHDRFRLHSGPWQSEGAGLGIRDQRRDRDRQLCPLRQRRLLYRAHPRRDVRGAAGERTGRPDLPITGWRHPGPAPGALHHQPGQRRPTAGPRSPRRVRAPRHRPRHDHRPPDRLRHRDDPASDGARQPPRCADWTPRGRNV
ncbi:MAG: Diadenosine tetraphosphatase, partial [uncultured Thermomicrobiales bacterium]